MNGKDSIPTQSPDEKEKPPRSVGPYKIESLLEKGGMSILYLGTHPETKEPVTIKILSPKFLTNQEVVQRFLKEAEIIAMADHPNIVKLYGYGEWEEGLYIAMEFIQGISLRQYLLQTPVTLKKALEIVIDIAYALCHLHTHGVIHRDLKPENILMTEDGHIKLIDFGISQLLTEKTEEIPTGKKRWIGTPIYMSPEQRENPETVSYPSDIYSLGIITYELVLGKLSHGQIHISLMPKGLQKIMNKALQYKPEDRYHDIVDFISDITTYLHSESLQKEMKAGDQLTELSENLKQARTLFVPNTLPEWPHLEIGAIANPGSGTVGFYDFMETHEGAYTVVTGESIAKGAEGILHTAYLRGMVKALHRQATDPAEFTTLLNADIAEDQPQKVFKLSDLLLLPQANELKFISCGAQARIWLFSSDSHTLLPLSAENSAIGSAQAAKYHQATKSWFPGSLLILSVQPPHPQDNIFSNEDLHQFLIENIKAGPQKIAEHIQRKIRLSPVQQIRDNPHIIICIYRHVLK